VESLLVCCSSAARVSAAGERTRLGPLFPSDEGPNFRVSCEPIRVGWVNEARRSAQKANRLAADTTSGLRTNSALTIRHCKVARRYGSFFRRLCRLRLGLQGFL